MFSTMDKKKHIAWNVIWLPLYKFQCEANISFCGLFFTAVQYCFRDVSIVLLEVQCTQNSMQRNLNCVVCKTPANSVPNYGRPFILLI